MRASMGQNEHTYRSLNLIVKLGQTLNPTPASFLHAAHLQVIITVLDILMEGRHPATLRYMSKNVA